MVVKIFLCNFTLRISFLTSIHFFEESTDEEIEGELIKNVKYVIEVYLHFDDIHLQR